MHWFINDRYEKTKNESFKTNALHYAKLTTKTDPNNPLFSLHYAHLLYKHGQLDAAIDYYKKTIDMDNERITLAEFKRLVALFQKRMKTKGLSIE